VELSLDPTPATPPLELGPGTIIDHYRVLRLLGRGGMGEVHLARDVRLGRKVALKVLRPGRFGSDQAVQRFLFEARATARFAHPHIITVFGAGQYDGNPYVALEYLEGQDLRQRMTQHPPSVREVLRHALAIADALREAHRHGILHRDLKPDNVMLPLDGRIRVVDFGLATVVSRGGAAASPMDVADTEAEELRDGFESRGEALRGTPAYMAPEQWLHHDITGATDVWALGVMLVELIDGQRPWQTTDLGQLAYRMCRTPHPPLRTEVPAELARLIDRCLDKDATRRPAIGQVVEVLEGLVASGGTLTSRERPPFRGLLPCDESDADRFFGRDDEIAAFVERLRREALLPVVGPSGAGKSSFVAAGVIPRLREQTRWLVLRLRPGRDPHRALASRLIAGESPASGLARTAPCGCGTPSRDRARSSAAPVAAYGPWPSTPPATVSAPPTPGEPPRSGLRTARRPWSCAVTVPRSTRSASRLTAPTP
jgi:serine/threonine protein kinase